MWEKWQSDELELPPGTGPETLSQTERLFRMAAALRAPYGCRSGAAAVSHRAAGGRRWNAIVRGVQRDLDMLDHLEPDFERLRGRPPRYIIHTVRSALQPLELLALHAAARLTYHRCSGEVQVQRRALQRLTDWAPARLQPVLKVGLSDLGSRRRSRETLNMEKAVRAWADGHPLRFEYRVPGGSGTWRPNQLNIYLIEVHPQNLELYALGLETSFHGAVRTFKLSRMRALEVVQAESYDIPETFVPQQVLGAAWGWWAANQWAVCRCACVSGPTPPTASKRAVTHI
ncbi:WYL domain-containing protein [Deinococcus radiophilus]|uniref:WYL domain-containing protein n=1 Tax=Deinococcus radiophilus TaxID=32062 RepID=UPI003620D6A2